MNEERKSGTKAMPNNIILENREKLSISGVSDVESFDEKAIVVYTDDDLITVKGNELHINKLSIDIGELVIEGYVDSIVYNMGGGKANKGSFFSSFFK